MMEPEITTEISLATLKFLKSARVKSINADFSGGCDDGYFSNLVFVDQYSNVVVNVVKNQYSAVEACLCSILTDALNYELGDGDWYRGRGYSGEMTLTFNDHLNFVIVEIAMPGMDFEVSCEVEAV